ncbi:XdhC family protein [Candidatus Foliamicus sp.]
MALKHLVETFREWRAANDRLVLGTVYQTAGSTYSKAGSRVLIDGQGNYQGLVSGGCLEGDLAEHAAAVLTSGEPRSVCYDMRGEHDELFGTGVGCEGMLKVLLQPLSGDGTEPWAPLTRMSDLAMSGKAARCAVVVEGSEQLIGRTTFGDEVPAELAPGLHRLHDPDRQLLVHVLHPVPRLLVLGAGVDAAPVVDFAERLGWRVTVCDHRPSYLERGDLGAAEQVIEVRPEQLAERVNLGGWSACVVMSHNLAADRSYLAALANQRIPWVGVLGPKARRKRLLEDLGEGAGDLREKLRGPVGLDIGASDPASIALSIMAELTASHAERSA